MKPCTKCDGQLEVGFVLDSDLTLMHVSYWCPGVPDLGSLGKRRAAARQRDEWRPIHAYRCASCGAVELYALDLDEAPPGTPPKQDGPSAGG